MSDSRPLAAVRRAVDRVKARLRHGADAGIRDRLIHPHELPAVPR